MAVRQACGVLDPVVQTPNIRIVYRVLELANRRMATPSTLPAERWLGVATIRAWFRHISPILSNFPSCLVMNIDKTMLGRCNKGL